MLASTVLSKPVLTSVIIVAIVTSASTPLGAQICRTLLRHNCLVLGIDEVPIPESERLFSSLGTHFQTLQLSLNNEDVVDRIVEHSKDRFWKQGFDILITFGEDESAVRLQKEISLIMTNNEGGTVVKLLDAGTGYSADMIGSPEQIEKNGVRANIVLLDGFASGTDWEMLSVPSQDATVEEVAQCTDRFRSLTEGDMGIEKGNKGVADLVLYLVSALGKKIDGAVFTVNGGWKML